MKLGRWDKGYRFQGLLPIGWFLIGPLVAFVLMFAGIAELDLGSFLFGIIWLVLSVAFAYSAIWILHKV